MVRATSIRRTEKIVDATNFMFHPQNSNVSLGWSPNAHFSSVTRCNNPDIFLQELKIIGQFGWCGTGTEDLRSVAVHPGAREMLQVNTARKLGRHGRNTSMLGLWNLSQPEGTSIQVVLQIAIDASMIGLKEQM